MRTVSFALFMLAAAGSILPAFGDTDPEMTPSGRKFTEIKPSERNPFSQKVEAQAEAVAMETESEEARLRRILSGLRVAGVSGSGTGKTVLLGTLILKQGKPVPNLLRNQAEVLKVSEISDESVKITFEDREAGAEPRLIVIPLRNKPMVTQLLFGEAFEQMGGGGSALPPLKSEQAQALIDDAKSVELINLTTRSVDLMGPIENEKVPEPSE